MRKSFVALLLMLGAAATLANLAFAQVDGPGQSDIGMKMKNAQMSRDLVSGASRLRASSTTIAETTWVGHSFDATHWNAVNNYWNIYVGEYAPGTARTNNALWDWDNTAGYGAVVNDSLQGWWPVRRHYTITGGLTLPDKSRPWWALDAGNVANYAMNQGQNKRTTGVIGVWHRDPGNTGQDGSAFGGPVRWTALAGSFSAWCGLRGHGDLTVQDDFGHGGESNYFNQDVMQFSGNFNPSQALGTSQGFPGYASQWDQMLYRDVTVANGSALNISFIYRTVMSTSADPNAATKTGIFYKDPKSLAAGNFISATDASVAIVDSFMVYVGAPQVDNVLCHYSDGTSDLVWDLRRRWFDEVIRCNEASVPFLEIFSAAGNNPKGAGPGFGIDSASASPSVSVSIPNGGVTSDLQKIITAGSNTVRIVFRVKTNRTFDDEFGATSAGITYSSTGRGAAIIDNVVANGSTIGNFEAATGVGAIDNRTGASPLNNWKSTGKPPGVFFHPHALSDLVYADLCGPPNSPARFCNIGGVVISSGDHDQLEAAGGLFGTAEQERMDGFVSPTINFSTPGPSSPNSQGLTGDMVVTTDDYYVVYDLYAGIYNIFFSGNAWTYGIQSYPAKQTSNGIISWGQVRVPGFQIFNPEPQCFTDIEAMKGNGLVRTSNGGGTGVPDSVRLYMGKNQQCFRFSVSLGCSPTNGSYFDNISLALVDIPGLSANNTTTLSTPGVDIWQWVNDAFPANETSGLPGTAAFDTCGAHLKSGLNTAQATNNELRFDIPGDSTAVTSAGSNVRLDLVFRILPGVGNYVTIGNRTSALRQVATSVTPAANGDGSFWGQYLADNGTFGTPGGHGGGSTWNANVWNSARCDTAEVNFFPVAAKGNLPAISNGTWASMYHESDPKFATLGISKNRCFMVDTGGATNSTNITCSTVPAWAAGPGSVPQSRTGYDGVQTTKEYTKIIPDGLLTPGAAVQYFFRVSELAAPTVFVSVPDSNFVLPQTAESSTDRHRWQSFAVLPDRWKDPAMTPAGLGMACMLYIDLNDRRGDEGRWMGVADSIGATRAAKYGAQNGWHAAGGVDYNGVSVATDPSFAVFTNGGQPGTTFDMYGVKASESLTTSSGAPGGRLANRAGMGLATGKEDRQGPTPEMLRTYYRILLILTGDLNSAVLGPFSNRSQNDVTLLEDFMSNINPSGTQPRGVWIQGDGFAQSEAQTGGVDPVHTTLMTNFLGMDLRDPSYQSVSTNLNDCADLIATAALAPGGAVYGIGNTCLWSNDLLKKATGVPEATEASFYQNTGVNGPYAASIRKPANATRNWISMVDGWDIRHLYSRFCDHTDGRLSYFYNGLTNIFGSICAIAGTPGITLDTPNNGRGAQYVNFMNLRNNPLSKGSATVHFGLARADRAQIRVFDVTGRLVKTLADRQFQAGEHDLVWDGTSDDGRIVQRGVYFTQVKFLNQRVDLAKRITVLK